MDQLPLYFVSYEQHQSRVFAHALLAIVLLDGNSKLLSSKDAHVTPTSKATVVSHSARYYQLEDRRKLPLCSCLSSQSDALLAC